ncbi:GNAT family N-acetyltransferase [Aureivirga marina]|uniref:GNAT family N-acetyltransferase n=1 Tax=Aureivirga marina TaxID=1182451 RepID=UPI0018C9D941|nr:GNAT family N-acetyltransferase [Aureivirga marina]
MIKINELEKEQFLAFFEYLDKHLSENGKDEKELFQPVTQEESIITEDWKEKFTSGFSKKYAEKGWRKMWIATNLENQIVGHIDIRSRMEPNTSHRVLLGMGVDSQFRKLKIGQKMLDFVIDYCKVQPEIYWLDLEVMSQNIPAISLYRKQNFEELTTTKDMFRIDGNSYDYTSMTLNVEN